MKKIFVSLILSFFTLTLLFGVAGCGSASIKGEEVTETQWDNALNTGFVKYQDFTIQCTVKEVRKDTLDFRANGGEKVSGKLKSSADITISKHDLNEYSKIVNSTSFSGDMKFINAFINYGAKETQKDTEEIYTQKIRDDKYKIYSKNAEDEWQFEEYNYDLIFSSMDDLIAWNFSPEYSDYKYDTLKNGYVLKSTNKKQDNNKIEVVIKFDSERRLCAIYYKQVVSTYEVFAEPMYAEDCTHSIVIDFVINYSSDKIDLPPATQKQ